MLLFILPALLIARWKSRQPVAWLQIRPPTWLKRHQAEWVVLLMLVLQPAINLLGDLNSRLQLPAFMADIEAWMQQMETANAATTELLLSGTEVWQIAMNFIVIGALAAFSEEILFRSALQKLFGNTHAAIWATAILFSCMHLQFYGFIPRMLMGALFGYAFVWADSLYIPIMMHLTNNVFVVLLSYIALDNPKLRTTIESLGTGATWWIGVISLAIGIWMMYKFRQLCQKNRSEAQI